MSDQGFSFEIKGGITGDQKIDSSMLAPIPTEQPVENENFSFTVRGPSTEDSSSKIDQSKSIVGGQLTAGVGALGGAGYGMKTAISKNVQDLADQLRSMAPKAETAEMITGRGLPPAQGPMSMDPAGGKGTYNWAKAFGADELEAAKARNMGEAWKMKQQADSALEKIGQLAPEYRGVPERSGLMLPQYGGSGPRGQTRTTLPTPMPQQAQQPSALQSMGSFMGNHPILSRTAMGGAAGFGAGFGGMEAARKFQKGDYPGAALSGLGAAASVGSMIPATAPVAIPLSFAAPIAADIIEGSRRERASNLPMRRRFESLNAPSPEEIAFYERMGPATSRQGLGFRP
jgi:hypothetical protein